MKDRLNYSDIVGNAQAHGTEEAMHESVRRVSDFIEQLRDEHPEEAKKFLRREYEALNGRHICDKAARLLVDAMWHTEEDENGSPVRVEGEIVPPEEAARLLEGMDEEKAESLRNEAYVAANGFAHDLHATGLQQDMILEAARCFWFHDEDFPDGDKVFWYYNWMMF